MRAGQSRAFFLGRVAGFCFEHPILDVFFHPQPSDDPAGNDGDGQSHAQVNRRYLPAEQPEQQHQRHFVDHRRGNQKGKRHAQRHAGGDKADEQRHRRAGTKRRHDAEQRRQHVAGGFASAGENPPRPFRREKRPHNADAEHDQREQHQHLGRFKHKELNRRAQVRSFRQSEYRVGKPE